MDEGNPHCKHESSETVVRALPSGLVGIGEGGEESTKEDRDNLQRTS